MARPVGDLLRAAWGRDDAASVPGLVGRAAAISSAGAVVAIGATAAFPALLTHGEHQEHALWTASVALTLLYLGFRRLARNELGGYQVVTLVAGLALVGIARQIDVPTWDYACYADAGRGPPARGGPLRVGARRADDRGYALRLQPAPRQSVRAPRADPGSPAGGRARLSRLDRRRVLGRLRVRAAPAARAACHLRRAFRHRGGSGARPGHGEHARPADDAVLAAERARRRLPVRVAAPRPYARGARRRPPRARCDPEDLPSRLLHAPARGAPVAHARGGARHGAPRSSRCPMASIGAGPWIAFLEGGPPGRDVRAAP